MRHSIRLVEHAIEEDVLDEMPLPPDWDAAVFDAETPFATRVKYAQARARKLGKGSSRVAFAIPYEGRETVLKIALNRKGLAQNEVEAEIMRDHYVKNLDIVIPMIDYDERTAQPTWLHVELATKAKAGDFVKACGTSLEDLVAYVGQHLGHHQFRFRKPSRIPDVDAELTNHFMDLVGNYDLPLPDLERLANWGIYQNRPVLVDVGLSTVVYDEFYAPKYAFA